MIKRTTTIFFGLVMIFNPVIGQRLKQQFYDLVSTNDTLGQQQLLEKWEKADSNDPELFVAYFNHFVIRSKKEIIALGQNPKGTDVLEITNQDSTDKEPGGYIYGETQYNPTLLNKGFVWIDKGIDKNPDRLDMRFGKIYIYGQVEDYENYTKEIIRTIDYSALNKNQWTWTDSEPLEDALEFMLGSIQDYQVQLYNTENDSLLDHMKKIAGSVLQYYPDHIPSLSNLSIVYMIQKEYGKALEPLLKAEKINPRDFVVLSNIAQAYKLQGDKKNAMKYYALTIKYGDEQSREFARGQMEDLKKQ